MDMVAPPFLIGSTSNLLVTRTGTTSRASSVSGQIRLFASELHVHALVRQIFSHIMIMEKMLTLISLRPVGQYMGVGERLHKVLGQIGSKVWFP